MSCIQVYLLHNYVVLECTIIIKAQSSGAAGLVVRAHATYSIGSDLSPIHRPLLHVSPPLCFLSVSTDICQ